MRLARLATALAAVSLAAPAAAAEPLTLEQAVATALANQPAIRSARAATRAAEARAAQARAGLLPQAQATGGLARADSAGPVTPGTTWSLGLSASQPLLDLGAWNTASQARSTAAAQAETEQASRADVVLGARTAWFLASAARDLVAVARETLANREGHLKQVQAFVTVGTRPEIDLAQARADRANSVVLLIGAENDLATALAQLNQAMGVVGSTDWELPLAEYPALEGEDAPIDALVSEALAHRPELAAQARQRDAQRAALRASWSGFVPTLDATGRLAWAGPEAPHMSEAWAYGLTLGWSFLEGGRTRAQVQEAQARLEALDADEEALRQAIRLELEQDRLAVRAARATLEADGEVLVNARERLRLAQGRYAAGLGSLLELDDAQVSVTTAGAQEVKARFTLAIARAKLARALGRP
jgi:outer membrane protein